MLIDYLVLITAKEKIEKEIIKVGYIDDSDHIEKRFLDKLAESLVLDYYGYNDYFEVQEHDAQDIEDYCSLVIEAIKIQIMSKYYHSVSSNNSFFYTTKFYESYLDFVKEKNIK